MLNSLTPDPAQEKKSRRIASPFVAKDSMNSFSNIYLIFKDIEEKNDFQKKQRQFFIGIDYDASSA